MKAYNSFEDEFDTIRLAIYEEIKDMTLEEETAYFRMKTEPILKRLGICTIEGEIVRRPMMQKEAVLA